MARCKLRAASCKLQAAGCGLSGLSGLSENNSQNRLQRLLDVRQQLLKQQCFGWGCGCFSMLQCRGRTGRRNSLQRQGWSARKLRGFDRRWPPSPPSPSGGRGRTQGRIKHGRGQGQKAAATFMANGCKTAQSFRRRWRWRNRPVCAVQTSESFRWRSWQSARKPPCAAL